MRPSTLLFLTLAAGTSGCSALGDSGAAAAAGDNGNNDNVGGDAAGDHDSAPGDREPPNPDFTTPAGAYVLLSPVAASPAVEDDHLTTSGPFVAEARVGHVSSLRSFGIDFAWDPQVLSHQSHERVDTWLTSAGGSVLPAPEVLDATHGTLWVGAAVTGAGRAVSTTSSEAVYRVSFAWVGAPAATAITIDLSGPDSGLVQDGAASALAGVAVIDLSVNP
ncbi:MAG: hypothetical protein HY903_23475 [Deltaproteobacteria bacterium]|nr:hypothetical protein [Deltaproteobacteria bacterium]